jgi:hypothetical protein
VVIFVSIEPTQEDKRRLFAQLGGGRVSFWHYPPIGFERERMSKEKLVNAAWLI